MVTQNVTLRVNSELYGVYRSYCKKKGLRVSQQFEIMMEETVGPDYKNKLPLKKKDYVKDSKEYVGSLTGEPFMIHENKNIAELLLKNTTIDFIKKRVVTENLLGYRTVKSVPKRVNAIIKRISHFDQFLLNKIANDLSGDGKLVILYSIYLNDRLFHEFIDEIIKEKFLTRDFSFDKRIIQKFISDKSESDRKLQEFTRETKAKLASVIFNILEEAGLLIEVEKTFKLKNQYISSELKNYLENKGDVKFLKSLGVSL